MTPAPIDLHIGKRIYQRRRLLGLPQRVVAESCSMGTQQVAKYECAECRVLPVNLLRLAHALDVEPGYFFEGFDEGVVR